jgi:hypothetical protein
MRGKAMRLPKNLGMILLAIWLILTGLMALVNIPIQGKETIMAILVIASGVLLLFGK